MQVRLAYIQARLNENHHELTARRLVAHLNLQFVRVLSSGTVLETVLTASKSCVPINRH